MSPLRNRYDIIFFFDVKGGNPNGDPVAGNAPRSDAITHQGLVSDVALKRRIRNYTSEARAGQDRYHIYVHDRAGDASRRGRPSVRPDAHHDSRLQQPVLPDIETLTRFFCDNFFDVRTFGAVIDTTFGTSHVRGPVQVGIATSLEPIETTKVAENARREVVPYALYRTHLFVNAKLAERTGFDETDLDHLLGALKRLFDYDAAAGREEMASRRLIAFKHRSALGNASAESLFARVKVRRKSGDTLYDLPLLNVPALPPARQFGDYEISVDRDNLSEQLEILDIL